MDGANFAIHWANEIAYITNLGPAAGYGIEAVAGFIILKKLANVVGGVIRG